MTARVRLRLSRLLTLFPRPPCPACRDRPVIIGLEPDQPEPEFPAVCPECRRRLPPVVCLVMPGAAAAVDRL